MSTWPGDSAAPRRSIRQFRRNLVKTELPLWIVIVTSGTVAGVISAAITGFINGIIASQLKPKADSYVTRFNATYKIREELAASILMALLVLQEACSQATYFGHTTAYQEQYEKVTEIVKALEIHWARSKIYFSPEITFHLQQMYLESLMTKVSVGNFARDDFEGPEHRFNTGESLMQQNRRYREFDLLFCEEFRKLLVAEENHSSKMRI
jgi:hypothetical protein